MSQPKAGLIYLAGGGDAAASSSVDLHFVRHLPLKTKLLYIPHASLPKSDGYAQSLDWLTHTLGAVGAKQHFAIYLPPTIEELKDVDLEEYNAIYMGGGNTYRLREILGQYNLANRVRNYHLQGGILYGGSAGAIVLGKTLKTVPAENLKQVAQHNGLGLLGGASVCCHFTAGTSWSAITQVVQAEATTVVCLSERAGVVYNSQGEFEDVGFEPAVFARP